MLKSMYSSLYNNDRAVLSSEDDSRMVRAGIFKLFFRREGKVSNLQTVGVKNVTPPVSVTKKLQPPLPIYIQAKIVSKSVFWI